MKKFLTVLLFCLAAAPSWAKIPVQEIYEVHATDLGTWIYLSANDTNWIQCDETIQDITTGKSSQVLAKVDDSKGSNGKDAFVKFKQNITDEGQVLVTENRVELYIKCNNLYYKILAIPAPKLSSRTVKLMPPLPSKIKANLPKELDPLEQTILDLLRDVANDQVPDIFETVKMDQGIPFDPKLAIVLKRIVKIEGQGIWLKEFVLRNESKGIVQLTEKGFVQPPVSDKPLAVAISKEDRRLLPLEETRLFVIQRVNPMLGMPLFKEKP